MLVGINYGLNTQRIFHHFKPYFGLFQHNFRRNAIGSFNIKYRYQIAGLHLYMGKEIDCLFIAATIGPKKMVGAAANTLVKTGLTGLSGGDMGDALASGLIGAGVGMLAPDVSSALADHLGMDPKNAAALTKVAQQYAPQLLRGGLSPQAALSLITKLIPANAGAQR
jgi:hypothetical protein